MPLVDVKEIPKRKGSGRKGRFPFTPQEVAQAIERLNTKGKVGCGPYTSLKDARTATAHLKNLILATGETPTLTTTAWEDSEGKCYGAIRVRES